MNIKQVIKEVSKEIQSLRDEIEHNCPSRIKAARIGTKLNEVEDSLGKAIVSLDEARQIFLED